MAGAGLALTRATKDVGEVRQAGTNRSRLVNLPLSAGYKEKRNGMVQRFYTQYYPVSEFGTKAVKHTGRISSTEAIPDRPGTPLYARTGSASRPDRRIQPGA
jgi:hypothetical protein